MLRKLVVRWLMEKRVQLVSKLVLQTLSVFGNVNDKESAIYKLRRQEQQERTYYVLEHIHTLPNINYLSKIRNTDEIIAGKKEDILYQDHI
jgi:hypothetical protein